MDETFGHNTRPEDELDLHDELESSEADEESQMKAPEGLRLSVRAVPDLSRHRALSLARAHSSLPATGYCLPS
ncbi:hypothetical protein NP233_g11687 [Leucocoprinus birnbaumii]|uniref:Uncharacterized protein n=1 Tax=Leucocoprinus birnbaumii TaxID=56174 RepID=A0AAD5VFY0_9AGAR|nr:hypothetical protein NP233_g11687 [Leucocoprinus birnbaumii]